jgi:hypothetical protein
MKLRAKGTHVTYEVAKQRALAALGRVGEEKNASTIAMAIWPDADFKAQGAGGAASRILKHMEAEGLCRFSIRYPRGTERFCIQGWVRT